MSQRAVAKISFAFELVKKGPNPRHSLGVFIGTGNKGNELFEVCQAVFGILSESCPSEPGQEWENGEGSLGRGNFAK